MHDSKDLGTEDNPKVLPEGHHVEGQSLYYQVVLDISPNDLKQKDAATKEEFALSYASVHPKLASPDAKSSAFVSSPHSFGSCWKWHPQTSACSELKAEMAKGNKKKNHNCMFFGSGVKRLSRKIASKALGRTVWSQHLLGLLLACHKKRSGAVCSFPSSAPRNMGLLASRLFSRLSCFSAWKTPWKKINK